MTSGFISGPGPWLALAGITICLLFVDLKLFAPNRTPTFREGAYWSIGWLVLALLIAPLVWVVSSADDAITYTTIYFVERSLSLDNLFVFLLLFSYFGIAEAYRARLLFWGIAAALVLRGLAILGGVALIERFHVVIYILGALLLVLAWRILRGVEEGVDPDRNLMVRAVRKIFPVANDFHGHHWFTRIDGRRYATPIFVCLAAIVAADIAFAIDSIPAAFAITRDSVLIWMANIFALRHHRLRSAQCHRQTGRAGLDAPRAETRRTPDRARVLASGHSGAVEAVRRLFVPAVAADGQSGHRRCRQLSLPGRVDPPPSGPADAAGPDE